MENNLTNIIFILDRSGSMDPLESDTIGGYNGFLKKQKAEKGEAVVTTVLFNDQYEVLHDRVPIENVQPLTEEEYYAGGPTALLDAIGKTLQEAEQHHRKGSFFKRKDPEKTIVVIITDGLENASKEYNLKTIKKMVTERQKKRGWEFIFLGANIDAVKTADSFGIGADRAVNFHGDSQGTAVYFKGVNKAVTSIRQSGKVGSDWRKGIDEDFESREKD